MKLNNKCLQCLMIRLVIVHNSLKESRAFVMKLSVTSTILSLVTFNNTLIIKDFH